MTESPAPVGLKLAAAKWQAQPTAANGNDRRTRSGKFTMAQLRMTDGIVPLQSGTNQFDSQRGKTGFGMPRNTQTRVEFAENDSEKRWQVDDLGQHDSLIRLQSGTNQFHSQKGMTGFGTGRDVCREGVHVNQLPADLEPVSAEKIRASDGIVRLQSGTNKYDSQKGMSSFGTPRDVRGKHLKRIWELEFPEEAMPDEPPVNQSRPEPENFPLQQQQYQQQQPQHNSQQQHVPQQAQQQQLQPQQQGGGMRPSKAPGFR